jgi:hypothetical protein
MPSVVMPSAPTQQRDHGLRDRCRCGCGTARRRTRPSLSTCSRSWSTGLDVEQGVLVVLDGSKALRVAVRGLRARPHAALYPPQGAQRARTTSQRDPRAVKVRLRRARTTDDHPLALDGLRA